MKILYILGLTATAVLAFEDIKYRKINILIAGVLWGISLVSRIWMGEPVIDIAVCAVTGSVFIGISFMTEGLGRGDGFAIGMAVMCLGFLRGIQVVCLSFFMMTIISLLLIVLKKAGKKTALPYVPWLLTAYLLGGIMI